MDLIEFQDIPSVETILNSENLNHNFTELETGITTVDNKIGDLSALETEDISSIVNAINSLSNNSGKSVKRVD